MVVLPLAVVMSQHLHDYLFCAILPTMPCVMCIYRRVVEGTGVVSAGCAVRVDMHED